MLRQKNHSPQPDNNGNGIIEDALTDKEKEDYDVEKQMEKTESATSLDFETEREKQLTSKCLKLLLHGRRPQSPSVVPKVGIFVTNSAPN